jgi:hypothetical protein
VNFFSTQKNGLKKTIGNSQSVVLCKNLEVQIGYWIEVQWK